MRNPVVGLETVAIAPFFNLSQERTVDGREFALDYYAELQKVPGFEVLPVGVTERAMIENGISLSGPEDAIRLAKILNVDAVVVGAVTDYDPYNPRIGLKVAWYSPRQWLFLPNEDPTVPFFNRSADAPVKQPGRPTFSTPRAQSPDDSGQWVPADFVQAAIVEDGNWKSVGNATNTPDLFPTDHGPPQLQPFLPDGTSLLVPAGDAHFPRLPLPEPVAITTADRRSSEMMTVNYQEPASPVLPNPAPAAEEIVPVQSRSVAPPVDFIPSPGALPIGPAESALPESSSIDESPAPNSRPGSEPSVRQPLVSQPSVDNPFNRHVPEPSNAGDLRSGPDRNVSDTADGQRYPTPPRVAAAEPEFTGSSQEVSTQTVPRPAAAPVPEPSPSTMAPVVPTPLFPMYRPEMNPLPTEMPRTMVPALVYDEHVVVAPTDFEPTEPLMAYVRLFDATDRRLIARLSDYLELTGQLRSGDLEAYMKRSEFFRKFTAHVMISEMLQLHGGEARRQLVLKPRKYR